MLHFLQNFTYYLMCEVVEPNWHVFERSLPEATTVDELIDLHERFLDACMKEGMLFWPKILRRLEKIKQSCLKFAEATAAIERRVRRQTLAGGPSAYGEDGEPTPRAFKSAARARGGEAKPPRPSSPPRRTRVSSRAMHCAESEFDAQLRELLESLNHSERTSSPASRACARASKTATITRSGREESTREILSHRLRRASVWNTRVGARQSQSSALSLRSFSN